MTDALKAAKKALRKEMGAKLTQIPEDDVQRQTDEVTQQILQDPVYQSAKRISVYVNTVGEIKTGDIIRDALKKDKKVFIPWFAKGVPIMQMVELKEVQEFDELQPILWGICQFPTIEGRKSYKDDGPLDLVLAPGVAFTVDGYRLGHGMAFYDKFFGEHQEKFGKMPTRYALALNQQILDCVPIDNTDVRMDKVVHGSRVELNFK